jgi:hypothetical protein
VVGAGSQAAVATKVVRLEKKEENHTKKEKDMEEHNMEKEKEVYG